MSRHRRPVQRDRSRRAVTTGPPQQDERFPLDYATWRAHLAATGSRFEPARSASRHIVYLDAAIRPAASPSDERQAA